MTVDFRPAPNALAWSHFQTVSQRDDDAHTVPAYALAIPNRGGIIQQGPQYKIGSLTVRVRLNPRGTWVVRSKKTTSLLDHERLHWMLGILVGYELERALLELRSPSVAALRGEIQAKFSWHQGTREPDLQRQYDDATEHSRDSAAQTRWRTNITAWYSNRASRNVPLTTS